MLPLILQTPREVATGIAERARALRLARGWTQQELAERAGVAVDTLRRFERTGRISLDRLLMIAKVVDTLEPFGALFVPPPFRTLAELEKAESLRERAARRSRAPRRKRKPE
jgi:transcriptional regulator with XRE-family HTH domain